MPDSLPRDARFLILELRVMGEWGVMAADHFLKQWGECRGSYDREDWLDRVHATIVFYQSHCFDGYEWLSTKFP